MATVAVLGSGLNGLIKACVSNSGGWGGLRCCASSTKRSAGGCPRRGGHRRVGEEDEVARRSFGSSSEGWGGFVEGCRCCVCGELENGGDVRSNWVGVGDVTPGYS